MKKLICTIGLVMFSVSLLAQTVPISTRASTFGWESVVETNLVTTGYDVLVAYTNIVPSSSITVPVVGGGVFVSARVFGINNTNVFLGDFLPNNLGVNNYNYWVRTVASHAAYTNYLVSDWTNLTSLYLKNPNSPRNVWLR